MTGTLAITALVHSEGEKKSIINLPGCPRKTVIMDDCRNCRILSVVNEKSFTVFSDSTQYNLTVTQNTLQHEVRSF